MYLLESSFVPQKLSNLAVFIYCLGNIRVYCRIRPAFSAEAKTAVDFIGEDGSLVVIDPLKSWKDGRKIFQFNRVFGPTATQGNGYCYIVQLKIHLPFSFSNIVSCNTT